MALTDARVLRSIELTESKSEKGSIQYSGSQDILILSDTKDPSFSGILADATVWPNLGSQPLPQIDDEELVNGVRLFVTSRALSYYKDNERAVVMTVRYDAKDEDAGGDGDPTSGDQDAWKRIQVQSVDVSKPARGFRSLAAAFNGRAQDQKPPVNSVNEPVDGLEEEASMLRFTYTNTIASDPNFSSLAGYANKCNSGALSILGVNCSFYTVRCTGFNAQYDQKNNTWSVTVELLYNPDGWEIRYFNVGFNEIVNGQRRAILDKAGNPVSSPVPLNLDGTAASPTVRDTDAEAGSPQLIAFYPYVSTDLGNLFRDARI